MKRDLRLYVADILENMDKASEFIEGLRPLLRSILEELRSITPADMHK